MTSLASVNGSLPVDEYVNVILQNERRPLQQAQADVSALRALQGVYSDLDSKLSTLMTKAEDLSDVLVPAFEAKTLTPNNADIVTGSASTSATVGSHTVLVTQLAKPSTMVTKPFTDSGGDIETNVGAGTWTFRVTVNGVDTDVDVTINGGDDDETVLNSTASAINSAFSGVDDSVTASVVHVTGTTSRLSIQSDQTGETYKVSLADVSGTLLSYIDIDDETQAATDSDGGYIYADSALSAQFKLDGLTITRDSNTVTDVLTGITLNLLAEQDPADDPVTLTVQPDTESIQTDVEEFLSAYNEALDYIASKSAVNGDTGYRGQLAGQFAYSNLRIRLREICASEVSTATGDWTWLSEIGISAADGGSLSISDSSAFEEALSEDPAKVAEIFNTTEGVAVRVEELIDSFVKTGGIIDGDEESISNQIDNMNSRIDRIEDRLETRERNLRKEFLRLQEALQAAVAQQNSLLGIMGLV